MEAEKTESKEPEVLTGEELRALEVSQEAMDVSVKAKLFNTFRNMAAERNNLMALLVGCVARSGKNGTVFLPSGFRIPKSAQLNISTDPTGTRLQVIVPRPTIVLASALPPRPQ